MACLLEFEQNERRNIIGVFNSEENAHSFLAAIPFVRKKAEDGGATYSIAFNDIPELCTVAYHGWQVVFSRFSYLPEKKGGEICINLIELSLLDTKAPENAGYTAGYTVLDAWSYPNSEISAAVSRREEIYRQAKEYYRKQGRSISRDGLGSEDGEYVLVSDRRNPALMQIAFTLDPDTIAEWIKAGNFENWVKRHPDFS